MLIYSIKSVCNWFQATLTLLLLSSWTATDSSSFFSLPSTATFSSWSFCLACSSCSSLQVSNHTYVQQHTAHSSCGHQLTVQYTISSMEWHTGMTGQVAQFPPDIPASAAHCNIWSIPMPDWKRLRGHPSKAWRNRSLQTLIPQLMMQFNWLLITQRGEQLQQPQSYALNDMTNDTMSKAGYYSLFFKILYSHLHLLFLICHVTNSFLFLFHPLLHLVKNFFQLLLACG